MSDFLASYALVAIYFAAVLWGVRDIYNKECSGLSPRGHRLFVFVWVVCWPVIAFFMLRRLTRLILGKK